MSFDFKISNGDISIGQNGDLQQVVNTEKLEQDVLKLAITPLGSNIFYPTYGSPISKSLIGTAFDMQFISTVASGQLKNSLQTLQKLQTIQATQQIISPSEQIAAVGDVVINRNSVDLRFFTVVINIIAKDLSTIMAQFNVKPGL